MNSKRILFLLIFHSSLFTLHSLLAQQYKVRSFCWERVEVTSELDAAPSAEAAAIVAPYKMKVDSIMAPPLGMSRVTMNVMRPESLLSNWAADVMVEGGTATGLERVVVLEMKGTDLLELMRNIAAVRGEGVSSSVRMEITESGELLSCTIGGKEIDPNRIYTIATIDYLAEGNDKMYALKKAVKRHETGILARDVMMESVIKHRVIDSKIEGRVKIKN